jgi:hypothetical protein
MLYRIDLGEHGVAYCGYDGLVEIDRMIREKVNDEVYMNKLMNDTMSRNRKKTVKIETSNEELIKQVFELYKPNKTQLFFLKAFGPGDKTFLTGNKTRVKMLSNVLNMTEEEIRNKEMIYYLGFK